ncbi:hypothetical protein A3D05_00860 [Candidatus Gottesmanbacteria bacterium RIFCSPHIGHO2_02_FULL_40_24]|nr:MAG: hypothetical protein A3D05_00860 [Candidatus Gottesmanbacteria bacterium RIFCSPHIGHO2_02_FULL_40_24]OGG24846.1 MAG: hypothetical protein A3E42_01945 [Candidatus Gottesmanbacteria bacterium RIFCSPHIGHO2_12_FULL_40_13]
MQVIYSPKYLNYYFEEGHPFWPERAGLFIELLEKNKFSHQLINPGRATDEDILLVHTRFYLQKLKDLANGGGGYLSIDTPVHKNNLEAAYYSVGGTILAAELALKGETVINTLGGLHHAESNASSGFCIFNDHAIAIRKLQRRGKIKKAAVLDLDVHAGNGTQEIFYTDPNVLKISLHQDPTNFYPGTGFPQQTGEKAGKGFNINIVLKPGTGEKIYLEKLNQILPKISEYKPDLLLVIIGVDTYKNDPLASIKLKKQTYGKIAQRLNQFDKKGILFAGGYSKDTPFLWFEIINNLD